MTIQLSLSLYYKLCVIRINQYHEPLAFGLCHALCSHLLRLPHVPAEGIFT